MVSPKLKAMYYAQLGQMVENGLTLIEAFSALDNKSLGGDLRAATKRLNAGLIGGEDFISLLHKETAAFSPFEINLIGIGVEGGSLGKQLSLLEEWFTKIQRFHWQIRKEMMFPFFLLVLAYIIVNVTVFVNNGPVVFFWQVVYPVLAVFAGLLVLYLILDWKYGEAGIEQGLGVHIPFLRSPIRALIMARFLRAFGSLTEAGLAFYQTVDLSLMSVGGGFLTRPITRLRDAVEEGNPFSQAMSACTVFPQMARQLLITGEKTGNISDMALKAAVMMEDEAELKLREVFKIFSLLFYLAVVAYIVYEVFDYWSEHIREITDSQ